MMDAARWQQVRDLFDRVVDLPERERQAQLQQVFDQDPELAREVKAVLADEARISGFMEAPLVPATSRFTPPEDEPSMAGREVGRYRLLEQIGQGGAGTVYLAARADQAYEQRVAIKILRAGLAGREAIRRFRTERQVLASLDHPSIARLQDGGTTEEGLPYVVMEHIDGLPIDRHCDQQRLAIPARLQLIREVCAAVHHAHQNLVIHRDLKPSNILVTADGLPKLLDFGIAKLLEPTRIVADTEPTVSWMRLMTPSYASPEQMQGKAITTATDIYALGVLLFRLLTGNLPFDVSGRSAAEVERLICEQEPPRPSAALGRLPRSTPAGGDGSTLEEVSRARGVRPEPLRRQLRGDLDTIVLKALHKEPGRRYGSAEQLAEDLRRYLEGFPVHARPDTVGYRLGKLVRRNRWKVAFAGLGAALLVGWALSATWLLGRVGAERDAKDKVLGYAKDVFKLADPEVSPGAEWTLQEALDRQSEGLAHELADEPAVRAELTGLFGKIYLSQGRLEKARDHLQQALELWNSVPDRDEAEVIGSLGNLAEVRLQLGDYDDALVLSQQAVDRARIVFGDRHEGRIVSSNTLVKVLCYRGEFEQAETVNREVLSLTEDFLVDTDPRHIEAVTDQAYIHRNLGEIEAAVRGYREALSLRRQVASGDHPLVAHVLANLAAALHIQESYDEAEALQREALAMRRKIFDKNHPSIAQSLVVLSRALRQRGAYDEAEAALLEAITILRHHADDSHPRLISSYINLAALQLAAKKPDSAEATLRDRLDLWRRVRPADDLRLAQAENVLGAALTARGRCAEARPLLEASTEELRERLGDAHRRVIEAQQRLEALYAACGNPQLTVAGPA